MQDHAVACDHIWKKFVRGERNDSLRDALPALIRSVFRRGDGELRSNEFWALRDVSFEVRQGQALGIIGPNGAGKSTLLKILSSILVADRGTVSITGRLSALIEVGAGFHQDLTGRENIFLNGALLGMTRREIQAKIGQIIEYAGIAGFIDTPIKRYSSGMQARLGFSVAAHMDPEILLVDEVLAVGDAQFQQRCLETMHRFAHSGKSIVFISHNLQAVSELCPQTMLLKGGRRECLGPTSEVIQRYLTTMRADSASPASGPERIYRVRLLNDRGEVCEQFHSGDKARLCFELEMDQPPSAYYLGFALKRATDGLIVSDYNMELPVPAAERGPLRLVVDFDVNFLTGSYAITLFLKHKASHSKPVYLDFVKFFGVTETGAYGGLTHVAPRLSCASTAAQCVAAAVPDT